MLFKYFVCLASKSYIICLLIIGFGISSCQFIELRVLPPLPSKEYRPKPNKLKKITWVDSSHPYRDGRHSPFLFSNRNLKNRYGRIIFQIQEELERNGEAYPKWKRVPDGSTVRMDRFDLETKDECYFNTTRVGIQISGIDPRGKEIFTFEYEDKIESHVTDCFLFVSTITAVPLFWYIPYQGFRGNRDDQLNQLGKNALREFFIFLSEKKND
jgi:hypothetical protein